jgi:hypothetical protein
MITLKEIIRWLVGYIEFALLIITVFLGGLILLGVIGLVHKPDLLNFLKAIRAI